MFFQDLTHPWKIPKEPGPPTGFCLVIGNFFLFRGLGGVWGYVGKLIGIFQPEPEPRKV